jgi:hypothetical protein
MFSILSHSYLRKDAKKTLWVGAVLLVLSLNGAALVAHADDGEKISGTAKMRASVVYTKKGPARGEFAGQVVQKRFGDCPSLSEWSPGTGSDC